MAATPTFYTRIETSGWELTIEFHPMSHACGYTCAVKSGYAERCACCESIEMTDLVGLDAIRIQPERYCVECAKVEFEEIFAGTLAHHPCEEAHMWIAFTKDVVRADIMNETRALNFKRKWDQL